MSGGEHGRLWPTFHRSLSGFGKLKRVENSLELGMPDVAYLLRRPSIAIAVSGWVELKHLPSFPARARTPVTFPSLTKEQVLWLDEWHGAGGRCGLVGQVGRAYFGLSAPQVRAFYHGEFNEERLIKEAAFYGDGNFPVALALRWLTQEA